MTPLARGSRQQPQQHRGFVRITHKRCPDCDIEGALTAEGRPVIIGGRQLRGATRYVGLTKATSGCETCEGTGSIPVDQMSVDSIDPYALKRAS